MIVFCKYNYSLYVFERREFRIHIYLTGAENCLETKYGSELLFFNIFIEFIKLIESIFIFLAFYSRFSIIPLIQGLSFV